MEKNEKTDMTEKNDAEIPFQVDELLSDVETVGIAGHIKPDGDCTGSTLALYNYIKDNYPDIRVTLYLEPIPNLFKFLQRSEEINHDFAAEDAAYDLFFSLDCGDEGRLGGAFRYFDGAKKTVCIDHHISNQSFADLNYIRPDASSTSELVFGLLDESKITKEIAECLYVGIIHDTGVFQYSCTSSKTMNIAGRLMDKGIDYPNIVDKTFFEKTFEQNQILGTALLKARRYFDDRCIATIITAQDMADCHALPKHLEGIVAQLRSTKGVDVAILIYENNNGIATIQNRSKRNRVDRENMIQECGNPIVEDDFHGFSHRNCEGTEQLHGTYKISMRTNGAADVAAICMKHGGGGHVRAAGATMSGDPEEILRTLLNDVKEQLH